MKRNDVKDRLAANDNQITSDIHYADLQTLRSNSDGTQEYFEGNASKNGYRL